MGAHMSGAVSANSSLVIFTPLFIRQLLTTIWISSQLKSINTDAHVAQSHRGKSGWLWGTPRMNIDISPHGMHFIDTIIMSFIVMEKYARQRHRAQPRRTGRPEDNLTEKPPQERWLFDGRCPITKRDYLFIKYGISVGNMQTPE